MSQNQNQPKELRRHSWVIPILILIAAVAVGVAIWSVFFRSTDLVLVPDHAPEVEENAEPIPNDSTEKAESPKSGGSVTLTYSDQVTIDLGDKTVALLLANPKKSNQDMVLQIIIQDTVIVQSGKLMSGNQVTMLSMLEDAAAKLMPGGYKGKFMIYYYNQESGEIAAVNTEIPISITVKN